MDIAQAVHATVDSFGFDGADAVFDGANFDLFARGYFVAVDALEDGFLADDGGVVAEETFPLCPCHALQLLKDGLIFTFN